MGHYPSDAKKEAEKKYSPKRETEKISFIAKQNNSENLHNFC